MKKVDKDGNTLKVGQLVQWGEILGVYQVKNVDISMSRLFDHEKGIEIASFLGKSYFNGYVYTKDLKILSPEEVTFILLAKTDVR